MTFLVGVDGGGSKTTAFIARLDKSIIGRGAAGSSNYRVVGIEKACASLDEALRTAFESANLEPDAGLVEMACFGLAGIDRSGDQVPLVDWVQRQWPGMPAEFVSDARLVLAAGTSEGWGVGVVCGTGSIVFGRSPDGRTARAGGWGYLLGDEGSGYDIGLAALRNVARAADGRSPQTLLTGLVLASWSLASPQDLINYVYRPQVTRTNIAALAVLVERAALQGDAVALAILEQAGSELALAVDAVLNKLKLAGDVPCALAGSLMVKSELVSKAFLQAAAASGLKLSPVQFVAEPALGAIQLAWERAQSSVIE